MKSKRLSKDEFDKLFSELWDNSKKIFKLETHQDYASDHDDVYEMFQEGKLEEVREIFREEWSGEDLTEKWYRVHLVNLPLNEYLKFEIECYKVQKEFGVEIKLIDFNEIEKLSVDKKYLIDYSMFDEKTVITNFYNDKFEYLYSELVESKTDIEAFGKLSKVLKSHAIKLEI